MLNNILYIPLIQIKFILFSAYAYLIQVVDVLGVEYFREWFEWSRNYSTICVQNATGAQNGVLKMITESIWVMINSTYMCLSNEYEYMYVWPLLSGTWKIIQLSLTFELPWIRYHSGWVCANFWAHHIGQHRRQGPTAKRSKYLYPINCKWINHLIINSTHI